MSSPFYGQNFVDLHSDGLEIVSSNLREGIVAGKELCDFLISRSLTQDHLTKDAKNAVKKMDTQVGVNTLLFNLVADNMNKEQQIHENSLKEIQQLIKNVPNSNSAKTKVAKVLNHKVVKLYDDYVKIEKSIQSGSKKQQDKALKQQTQAKYAYENAMAEFLMDVQNYEVSQAKIFQSLLVQWSTMELQHYQRMVTMYESLNKSLNSETADECLAALVERTKPDPFDDNKSSGHNNTSSNSLTKVLKTGGFFRSNTLRNKFTKKSTTSINSNTEVKGDIPDTIGQNTNIPTTAAAASTLDAPRQDQVHDEENSEDSFDSSTDNFGPAEPSHTLVNVASDNGNTSVASNWIDDEAAADNSDWSDDLDSDDKRPKLMVKIAEKRVPSTLENSSADTYLSSIKIQAVPTTNSRIPSLNALKLQQTASLSRGQSRRLKHRMKVGSSSSDFNRSNSDNATVSSNLINSNNSNNNNISQPAPSTGLGSPVAVRKQSLLSQSKSIDLDNASLGVANPIRADFEGITKAESKPGLDSSSIEKHDSFHAVDSRGSLTSTPVIEPNSHTGSEDVDAIQSLQNAGINKRETTATPPPLQKRSTVGLGRIRGRLATVESINAYFKGAVLAKTLIEGQMVISLSPDAFQSINQDGNVVLDVTNPEVIAKFMGNPKIFENANNVIADNGKIVIPWRKLQPALKKGATGSDMLAALFTYEVNKNDLKFIPLRLCARWTFAEDKTQLLFHYMHNSEATNSALTHVQIFIQMEKDMDVLGCEIVGGYGAGSLGLGSGGGGKWDQEKLQLLLKLDRIDKGAKGQFKVVFNVGKKGNRPVHVAVKFAGNGQTISGFGLRNSDNDKAPAALESIVDFTGLSVNRFATDKYIAA